MFHVSFHSVFVLFSSPSGDCSELRSQIYGILQGLATPDVIAMNLGSQPDWTRVITQECPVSLQVQLNQESEVFKKKVVFLLISHLFCPLS